MERLTIHPENLTEAAENLTTIRDFIRFGVTALRQYDAHLGQGTEDFFAESSALVLQTLALDWEANEEILDAKLLPSEKTQFLDLLARRINERIPTSYLLNLAYFCNKPFYVDERVLIPRSPIAELIHQRFAPYFLDETGNMREDLNALPKIDVPKTPQRILDMCTGSGCIAIALAYAYPEADVDATDISRDALEVAALNVEHHNMQYQVALLESDLFSKLPAENQYDLIVTNPPYVDAEDMADLPEEFLHEPELALAAGQDGLDLVRKMLAEAADYLSEDGLIVIEVGNSEWAMRQNFNTVDFHWLKFQKGGSGIFALTAEQCRRYKTIFQDSVKD
ncbi:MULTISPECIES: 50S ribosomal protein L3 N(5)-glutamine methyltransferase [Acinetobacter]|uniref:Ribosomal protein uL3 glutamine methyltransferase n=1 Tax=Acinetobacter pollinis TaxID=2605270 RepID=A0ABU6DV42_9GAMM|nr:MULTISPECIES: 50S ribosomal protein L3 N(5)-glutamine methyltransferase [Acinetobacter]MCF9045301.1 50S ribosomal protein L3 N(5)-glutamine methyltransferase [Acinetobacter nectaris]MBF7691269.1 50S ribosomal protein L3 N(5)-glutamine methyltransferase [Acinetobacter pollinis]MBF7693997.1 50S ribosomal protein L3 N(5)-glutamine methyltransferase [Acinetobacter pollinis]MBF7698968.1 50S ribosomal protein L3 N(5)-glutamine methyltransferase [Acinetobacter pollinis]MBF7701540.1 50S ribosomal p